VLSAAVRAKRLLAEPGVCICVCERLRGGAVLAIRGLSKENTGCDIAGCWSRPALGRHTIGTGHGDGDNDAGIGTSPFFEQYTRIHDVQQRLNLARAKAILRAHDTFQRTTSGRCRNACAELRTRFSQRFQGQRRERATHLRAQREGKEYPVCTAWGWFCGAEATTRDSDNVSSTGREATGQWICGEPATTAAQSGTCGPGWHWGSRSRAG